MHGGLVRRDADRRLAGIEAIVGALVVSLDLPGSGFFMPLFVQLADNAVLGGAPAAAITGRLRGGGQFAKKCPRS